MKNIFLCYSETYWKDKEEEEFNEYYDYDG